MGIRQLITTKLDFIEPSHHELAADQIAQAGVYVHTHAARTAINARAGHSIIAGDVLDALGEAHHHARNILSGHSEIWSAL